MSEKTSSNKSGSSNAKESTAGITAIVVIAIIVVLNYLVGGVGVGNFRLDLTENKVYTLSEGTEKILARVSADKPVTIRFYETTDDRIMPSFMKPFARTVEDLLLEFEKAAGSEKVTMEKYFPNPNTDDEDKAREDELQGRQVNQEGDNVYLGFTVQCGAKKEVVPFILPNEETQLEYYVARAINKVIATNTTVIGVMSQIPVQGSPMYPYQRQQGQEPWQIVQQLRRDYEVREVAMTSEKIDSDVTVLLVIHPGDITEKAEFAIDQYLLKGGKVLAFVDPQCWVAQAYNGRPNPMTGQSSFVAQSSDLPNLLKAWGIGYKKDMVVVDMNYRDALEGRVNPTALLLRGDAIGKDRVTEGLPAIKMASAGALSVAKIEGIDSKVLLESSEASDMIDSPTAESLRNTPLAKFNNSGRKKVLGVRLTGKFATAFPNGAPKDPAPPAGAPKPEGGGAQTEAGAPAAATPAPAAAPTPAAAPAAAPAATPAAAPATPAAAPATPAAAPAPDAPTAAPASASDGSLKESVNSDGLVMIFSDADMLHDFFALAQDQRTGGFSNANLPLFLNSIESMAGGGDLLAVRSRASVNRPFVKLDEMRAKVEQQYRPKVEELEGRLQDTVTKLASRAPNANGVILVDPTKDKEFKELKETQVEINREIRQIKKQQTADVDRIKSMLMWLNIAAMPLLVIVVGLLLAMRRQSTTAAR